MEAFSLDFATIMCFCTTIVTYGFAELSKRFKWLESKKIPYQNAVVGILAGVIVYCTGLCDNIATSIIICTLSAFSAGGMYDFVKRSGVESDEEKH